ncbi:MAG: family acetyltransferase [Solirubrobacterales bacterium]|jgi:predicted GNAT family N-acyltransferase|nr:family acetyltransferase [Solirubrobacterales bacterium]
MGGVEIPIRWATGPEDVRGALVVRDQVFCGEQGVPRSEEVDEADERALHLVGVEPGEEERVIATLRVLIGDGTARIGRVAVERPWRRRGVAGRMLDIALSVARERGCHEARLAAQVEATGLYERAGFTVESDPFEDAGIPHVWMGRSLDSSDRGRGKAAASS